MWLRDGLPYDLEGARVLSYGYNSKLIQSQTFQSVEDIATAFLISMRSIRIHDRVSALFENLSRKLTLIGWSYSSAFDFYFPQPRGDNFEKGTAPLPI
jgi:hypothetical protein